VPAYYIVLEKSIPGVEATGLYGRSLSAHNVKLEALARQAGVPPLLTFFSLNPEELAKFLEDHQVGESVQIPEERWFSAEEGLNTVSALLKSLAEMPTTEASILVKELAEFQRVLQAAGPRNVRWHLGIDI
jgi:hypothetical protein